MFFFCPPGKAALAPQGLSSMFVPATACLTVSQVMKCVVEVISDSLSKPSPMPVSPECLEILQGGRSQRLEEGLGARVRVGVS